MMAIPATITRRMTFSGATTSPAIMLTAIHPS
jgi:hypothetical protein